MCIWIYILIYIYRYKWYEQQTNMFHIWILVHLKTLTRLLTFGEYLIRDSKLIRCKNRTFIHTILQLFSYLDAAWNDNLRLLIAPSAFIQLPCMMQYADGKYLLNIQMHRILTFIYDMNGSFMPETWLQSWQNQSIMSYSAETIVVFA